MHDDSGLAEVGEPEYPSSNQNVVTIVRNNTVRRQKYKDYVIYTLYLDKGMTKNRQNALHDRCQLNNATKLV